MNNLPLSLYGQRVFYKVPFDDIEDRKLLRNGDENFKKMCKAALWTKAIDIFVEPDIEGDVAEREENERDQFQFDEEARVERNVTVFVDDEIDEYATSVCSDDDEYDHEGRKYFRYKKGSGELKLQMVFDSLEAFKKAMLDYVLKHGWNVKYTRWDKDLSELHCASVVEGGNEPCRWKIYYSYEAPVQKWMVKSFIKCHTCMKTGHSKLITQDIIARLFVNDIRENPTIRPKDILEDIYTRWELIVSIDQCRNAKKRALEIIQKEHDLQFSKLKNYQLELLTHNPESTIDLNTYQGDDGIDIFCRFYVCFGASKKTWCSHCRPILGLDACFLKCTLKGQLLAAVGRDANNQMFPIAWAIVDVENEPNWNWFIKKLQNDLNLHDGDGFTIISDRQKGLLNVVSTLLPKVEHMMCAKHIYENLKKKHLHRTDMKGLFWKVAKSYKKPKYNKRMDAVKAYDMDVFNSMMMKNPQNCSLAYFIPSSTCDEVSNNISESFNAAIDPARLMPPVEMLETIRRRAMLRIDARRDKALKHRGKFNIKAMEKVEEEHKKIRYCKVFPAERDSFEVKEKKSAFLVKMIQHTCTCQKWKMSGVPCQHALKVISEKKWKREDYIDHCYLTSKWRKQYETPIEGVRGTNFWEGPHEPVILPPHMEQGETSKRRKKVPKRIKGKNESPSKKKTKVSDDSPTEVSREKRISHCGRCGNLGHNARNCQNVVIQMHIPPKKEKCHKINLILLRDKVNKAK